MAGFNPRKPTLGGSYADTGITSSSPATPRKHSLGRGHVNTSVSPSTPPSTAQEPLITPTKAIASLTLSTPASKKRERPVSQIGLIAPVKEPEEPTPKKRSYKPAKQVALEKEAKEKERAATVNIITFTPGGKRQICYMQLADIKAKMRRLIDATHSYHTWEPETRTLTFPDFSLTAIEQLMYWAKNDALSTTKFVRTAAEFGELMELYRFAQMYKIFDLCNDICDRVNVMFAPIKDKPALLEYLRAATRELSTQMPLFLLVVDIFAWNGGKKELIETTHPVMAKNAIIKALAKQTKELKDGNATPPFSEPDKFPERYHEGKFGPKPFKAKEPREVTDLTKSDDEN